jgi:hypothetical protein
MLLSQFRMQARPGGGIVVGTQVPLYQLSRGETHEGAYAHGLNRPMSLNMVAVHNRRDFGLLAKARRKSRTMTPN